MQISLMCHGFNISIQFPSILVFLNYNCIMLHHHFSLSQAKVSRVSALICSKSSSWKLIDESMNRWLPNDFCRQRRAFCRVADPKSSASQQSDGLKVPLKKFKCGLWSLQEHGNRRNSAPLRMFMYRQREWGWPARGCPGSEDVEH